MKEAEKILLDLKRKIYKPVYFLSGEEAYYIDLISDFIEENVLDEGNREFDQDVVYGKDIDLAGVLGLAKQFPMMSEQRVVIVKEAQNIKELNKSAGGDDEDEKPAKSASGIAQLFAAYLANPQPSTILVFCFKYKSIDKRSAIAKALQKHAVFFEPKKMYDNQLQDWIVNYVKEKGFVIVPKAAFLIGEFIGNDLSKVTNELGKLFINLKPGAEISAELIQNNIGISKEFNVFELHDALARKDILKANRIVNYFAANEKDNPTVVTISTLYSYFSKILKYHFLPDKSKFAAAGALGVNPFFVDGYAKASANYSTAKLKSIFSYLKECDLKSKGVENSGIENGELLKELVFKIMH